MLGAARRHRSAAAPLDPTRDTARHRPLAGPDRAGGAVGALLPGCRPRSTPGSTTCCSPRSPCAVDRLAARPGPGTGCWSTLEGHGREELVDGTSTSPGPSAGSPACSRSGSTPARSTGRGAGRWAGRRHGAEAGQGAAAGGAGQRHRVRAAALPQPGHRPRAGPAGPPAVGFNYLGRLAAWSRRGGLDPPYRRTPSAAASTRTCRCRTCVALNAVTVDLADGPRLRATWTWAGDAVPEAPGPGAGRRLARRAAGAGRARRHPGGGPAYPVRPAAGHPRPGGAGRDRAQPTRRLTDMLPLAPCRRAALPRPRTTGPARTSTPSSSPWT